MGRAGMMRGVIAMGLLVVGLAGCGTARGMLDRGPVVAAAPTCTPMKFEIYFADSEARLTEPARQAIGMTATQLQGCDIRSVRVIGLADARGGAQANQELSARRATAVVEALEGAGWPAPLFDITAVGDEGAADPNGIREPLRRRTEVLVEAAPRL